MTNAAQGMQTAGYSPIVELRQYTLHSATRETLIELFDSTFVESQEATGMRVIGQFRDLDRADRFVWLRGFETMDERAKSLATFYGGPVWKAHREAANATMVDSDDVLLLRPVRPDTAFSLAGTTRPNSTGGRGPGFVEAVILHLDPGADQRGAVALFEAAIAPAITAGGGSILGYFVTELSRNTFPSLPVREGEEVLVWCAGFRDRSALERASRQRRAVTLTAARSLGLRRPPDVLHLAPTSCSLLHGGSSPCRAMSLERRLAVAST